MAVIRVVTWNLRDWGKGSGPVEADRVQAQAEVVRGLDADVLVVQEVVSDPGVAGVALRRFAEGVGMDCMAAHNDGGGRGVVAVGVAASGYHVGLLWRPGIAPVPGSWRAYAAPDFHHALAVVRLDVGGPVPVRVGSYHGDPFRPERRFAEAARVVSALTRPRFPGLVGGDWNGIGSDRVGEGGGFCDPDPYAGLGWFPDLTYQVAWDDDPGAGHRADRRPTERVRRAGLHDVAVALGAPWRPTTGHDPGDPFPPRRVDAIRVSSHLLPALRGYEVIDTPAARATSDHLPVVAALDLARLAEGGR